MGINPGESIFDDDEPLKRGKESSSKRSTSKTVGFNCQGITIYPHDHRKSNYWRSSTHKGLDTGEYITDTIETALSYSNWVGKGGYLLAIYIYTAIILDVTGDAEESIEEIEEEVGFEIPRDEVGFAADALEYPGVSEKLSESYDLVKFTEIEPYGVNTYKYLGPSIKTVVAGKYYERGTNIDAITLEEIAIALLKNDKKELEYFKGM